MKVIEKTITNIELEEEDKEVFCKAYTLMIEMCRLCSSCDECPCHDENAHCTKNDMRDILETLEIDYEE